MNDNQIINFLVFLFSLLDIIFWGDDLFVGIKRF